MKLYAPKEYWEASKEEREDNCNGCGSELGLSRLIPESILGLKIKPVCCKHDWMYVFGKTLGDKLFADAMFIYNLTVLILRGSKWLVIPRLLIASNYYIGVVVAGNDSFFVNKERNKDSNITFKGEFRDA